MEQVKLKDIRDFQVFKFSEHESNCLKMAFRADNKIAFVSVSKEVFFADENTLVLRSDEPNTNPLYSITFVPKDY